MNELTRCLLAAFFSLSCGLFALAAPTDGATLPESPPEKVEPLKVTSPDGTIEASINVDGPLSYSVTVDGRTVIENARLGLKLREGTTFGADVELASSSRRKEDSTWENPFGKRRVVTNQHRELSMLLRERSANERTFQLVFRVFDDGVAFRYTILSQPGLRNFVLDEELTEFRFPADATCFAGEPDKKGFHSAMEWEFRRQRLSDITPETVKGLPLLVETPVAWVAITEADLLNWSGMWLAGQTQDEKSAIPAAGPLTASLTTPMTPVSLVAKLAPRLDKTGLASAGLVKGKTPHSSPWRVLMIGRQPGRLIESEIIRNLSTPSKLGDVSWIKPGMMAWDHWWTGDSVMDTATIKAYIQLAADMGWEYQLIDWQWYGKPEQKDSDITKVIPSLDMDEVRRFAAERGVKIWLWLHWTDVDRELGGVPAYTKAFPLYEEWGIAGVKIDFMDRDDQEMVEWYEKIATAAAEHKLMVNFHGAFKTSGFDRTYPNQVTREGILGNEYNKWTERITPEHKVTLPFTRFLAGPADFTPGGFLNRQPDKFQSNVKPTQVQGTRAAELALFVCYDSPVCCVCEHPDRLRDQPGANFLEIVPTVWDDTRVLDAVVGEHLVMARQSGDAWYLGAMTDRQAREIPVKLDFLNDSAGASQTGKWKMKLWRDADDSGENAEHLTVDEQTVSAGDPLTLKLAPAGGAVAVFERE